MERKMEYQIVGAAAGQPIRDFLQAKGYSRQNLIELKKNENGILINNEPQYMNYLLKAGDCLTVHIRDEASSEKIPPVELPLRIVYEDEDLMVINKPAGMPIHPSLNNYYNSLANGLAWYFEQRGEPFVFRCINRLDRDTSGLTIIAKHMVSAGILSGMVARREIHREYLAIVDGTISPSEGTVNAPIARKGDSIIEREVNWEHGETAVTHYKTLKTQNGYSLLSLHLETGRTHQIRVHMKHLGFPLIGDYLYNPDTSAIKRQALHSYRLQFQHPMTGEAMDFVAQMPDDMTSVLTY